MNHPSHIDDGGASLPASLKQTVSATRLGLFLQCRLKFWFRYVLLVEKPKSPALRVGSSVHSALETWNKARWRRKPVTSEELHRQFLNDWQRDDEPVVDWGEREAEYQETAWRLVETYLRETPLPPNQLPEAVEVPVEANLGNPSLPRLIGVLDLVQAGIIVDFKTASSTPSPEKAAHLNEIQTTCYAVLYRESTGRVENGIELHTLVKLKTPKLVVTSLPPVDDRQLGRLYRQIKSYMEGISRNDWVPSPGLHCAVCEYFSECKQWQ